jgi:hypothetical protein
MPKGVEGKPVRIQKINAKETYYGTFTSRMFTGACNWRFRKVERGKH